MKTRKGLSLLELIVIVFFIIFLLFISIILPQFPRVGKVESIAHRVSCGTNLKGLGTAMTVYANDYNSYFPQLRGTGPWSKELGFPYDMQKPDFQPGGAQSKTGRTISASWYLLVREADVAPKSFICPASNQLEFSGKNPQNRDIVKLWDFGTEPYKHVSYAIHNPYGKFPASTKRGKDFAVAADMNPWIKDGDIVSPLENNQSPQIIKLNDPSTWKMGNTINHPKFRNREWQNVLYADGHNSYETKPNVGVNKDNIFTFHSTDKDPTEQDIQGGTNPASRDPDNDAKSEDDSFLAI